MNWVREKGSKSSKNPLLAELIRKQKLILLCCKIRESWGLKAGEGEVTVQIA